MAVETSVAVLAKAPISGFAKTRLIPVLGAHGAAVLHERLLEHAVTTAVEAEVGRVTLWCTPDIGHATFQGLAASFAVTLKRQPDGDLGDRMLGALAAASGPALVIGTDCPALTAAHLRDAAAALETADVVVIPAEDGGYTLIGTKAAQPGLFENVSWGGPDVMAQTRQRIAASGLRSVELATLWDVDDEADLARLERDQPLLAI